MRRRTTAPLLAAALLLFTGACSSDTDTGTEGSGNDRTASESVITRAEEAAARTIFEELEQRFPDAGPANDVAAGGSCPYGEQYGEAFIETAQVLCFNRDTFEVSGVTPVRLANNPILAGLEATTDDTGTIEWLQGDVDGEPFVFVERIVANLSVFSAQAVLEDTDTAELATMLSNDLDVTAVDRVRALAGVDLDQLLAQATEVFEQ